MIDDPQQFLKNLPNKPGVYQMYDVNHKILYIGKAKSLKKRLRSYFYSVTNPKTIAFMEQVKSIEIIITTNEITALLLESNLIKTLKPHYNILFKDDKSFPYLFFSQHDFPRLCICRNSKMQGKYFGPFPSTKSINLTLKLLQKIFSLRVCNDAFLRNRTRPCILYQIKLCSAPCVGYIDKTSYESQIELTNQFLCNKNDFVIQKITKLMDNASAKLAYEQAAVYRDQITSIRKVQAEQIVIKNGGNYDVIVLATNENAICIDIMFVRNGLLLGNKTYFSVSHNITLQYEEILTTFIIQHYLQNKNRTDTPAKILLGMKLHNRLQMSSLLSKKFGHKVVISDCIHSLQKQLINMAKLNAINTLKTHCIGSVNYLERLINLKETLHLSSLPTRIECFDVSHTMGEAQVGVCVVFDAHGANKNEYRRFNISTAASGDDYGALQETLSRRFHNLNNLPNLVIIDGGRGQLGVIMKVLKELQINDTMLIAIAKDRDYKRGGLEKIYVGGNSSFVLPQQSLALHFIQQIRDEAHRFAISDHRKKMIKLRRQSILENITGIGKIRRIALLKHFGGLNELKNVGVDDIAKVKNINQKLARHIYEYLHAE